jgi:hypothetical protein
MGFIHFLTTKKTPTFFKGRCFPNNELHQENYGFVPNASPRVKPVAVP